MADVNKFSPSVFNILNRLVFWSCPSPVFLSSVRLGFPPPDPVVLFLCALPRIVSVLLLARWAEDSSCDLIARPFLHPDSVALYCPRTPT